MITVLIAEDDPAMREVLKSELMKIPGIEVVGEAEDGIAAINMVEELNPWVIFIDIDLPGKDGVEVAREICDIDPCRTGRGQGSRLLYRNRMQLEGIPVVYD